MQKLSAVLVNLQNPREKIWGILLSIQASGVTIRGIDLNSFDDWSRGVARGDQDMGLSTLFFPLHRIERVHKDETVGGVQSMAELFEARVGRDVWSHLGLKVRLGSGESKAEDASVEEWLSLGAAERDYIERVMEHCEWDRSAAAGILDLTEDSLADKLRELGYEAE